MRHFLLILLLSLASVTAWSPAQQVLAQDDKEANEAAEKEKKRRAEVVEALTTLGSILKTKSDQVAQIKDLKRQLRTAKEEASRKELEEEIQKANTKLEEIEAQILALTTGVAADALGPEKNEPFNLQNELEGLIQPFIKMMKGATENARKIEQLKDQIQIAQKRRKTISRALSRLGELKSVQIEKNGDKGKINKTIIASLKEWREKEKEAANLEETAKQQLTLRLEEAASSSDGMASYATGFFKERGLNLLLAMSASGLVLLIAELISRGATWLRKRQGIRRNFWTRLGALTFRVASIVAAFLAMLIIFNVMNDWLLLGVASLFALAAAWLGLTMLPSIVEQVTLLLNLGAVQEDERLMIDGVPWKVEKLDLYTDLVNPALDGGSFTVPVRELVGKHSRPSGISEPWFPSKTGDWIHYDDGEFGQVISQTPELVQVKERGGSLSTFETAAFLAKAPRNLSSGFRIRTEFGLDYSHQKEATSAIPSLLREHVHKGLKSVFGETAVAEIDVDLLRAADSAIIFEVETIFPGYMAPQFEDIERETARLLVDAANTHNWSIPFPQLVVHGQRMG